MLILASLQFVGQEPGVRLISTQLFVCVLQACKATQSLPVLRQGAPVTLTVLPMRSVTMFLGQVLVAKIARHCATLAFVLGELSAVPETTERPVLADFRCKGMAMLAVLSVSCKK